MVYKEDDYDVVGKIFKSIMFGVFILLLFFGMFGCFFTVQPDERAMIYSWNGGLKSEVYAEGIHFKVPFMNSVIKMNTRVQKQSEEATAATSDLQDVKTTVAVNFRIDPTKIQDIYRTIGQSTNNEDYMQVNIINPVIQESVKMATAKYTAGDLIKNRDAVKKLIDDRITERLLSYNLFVSDVSITNFEFSPSFTAAIEAKVSAEQNALTEQNKVEVVKFQAQQKIEQAKGDAEAMQIINNQLEKSPQYISYITTQKWNGVLPLVTGGASPMVDVSRFMNLTQ